MPVVYRGAGKHFVRRVQPAQADRSMPVHGCQTKGEAFAVQNDLVDHLEREEALADVVNRDGRV